ncbi:MAG: hypothetical protein ABIJ65_03595 [Chloroflexota bacterium]
MKAKLQKNWKQYLVMGLIGVWIIAFIAIFYISAEAGCTDSGGILKAEGICLTRGIAGLSCFAGFIGLWTFLGGEVARGKGRNPLIGMILGLTLEFMGCLFMLTWEPRRDFTGRMIGWDEYKDLSPQQKEAMRPVREPIPRNRKILVAVIIIFTVLVFILIILQNLGKIG